MVINIGCWKQRPVNNTWTMIKVCTYYIKAEEHEMTKIVSLHHV